MQSINDDRLFQSVKTILTTDANNLGQSEKAKFARAANFQQALKAIPGISAVETQLRS